MPTENNAVRPVILMRPGAANRRLSASLALKGVDAWLWPAFEIVLPHEEESRLLEARLANLDDVEMVILPSPSAVAAVSHWVREWPSHITLACVGSGTASAIRAAWGDDVPVLYPEGSAEKSGSEALWELVRLRGAPSRVLILRGQTGREWLAEQFRSIGSDVQKFCAYIRVPLELDAPACRQLMLALQGPSPVVYVTSTDAVDALFHAVHAVPDAHAWLAAGTAVTLHPRVAKRLQEAGFTDIVVTAADDETVTEEILAKRTPAG